MSHVYLNNSKSWSELENELRKSLHEIELYNRIHLKTTFS